MSSAVSAKGIVYSICCAAALLSVAACAPSGYVVKTPAPSGLKYETATPQTKTGFSLIDSRKPSEQIFHSGILSATLSVGDSPIDAPQFLALHLQEELVSRGVPAQVTVGDKGLPRINLKTFRIQNHRANAYSPFVTFTFLSVDLETATNTKRIGVFIKRGKIPVWSFSEIVEPTFNQPLSLAVRELAGKIVKTLYGYQASAGTVSALITRLGETGSKSEDERYFDVYSLGFTNNPKAIDTLVRLTSDSDEYVRLAAISSLGNIGATGQFSLLKSIYQNRASIWQDRAMALKAIGDLGTSDALTFMAQEKKRWEDQPRNQESTWTLQIIQLYL